MAKGALARADVNLAIAVTGIAGPGGATATKPLGLVHIAVACHAHGARHERHLLPGDRAAIRLAPSTRAGAGAAIAGLIFPTAR